VRDGDVLGPGEAPVRDIGAPTARIAQRITGSAEPPEPMTDEAPAEAGRVVLAITIDRVGAISYVGAGP
jgi:hypothetical protein